MSNAVAKTFGELVEKFNPYHDSRGRFTSAGGATSFSAWRTNLVGYDKKKEAFENRKNNSSASSGVKAIEIETENGLKLSYRVTNSGVITDLNMSGPKNTRGMTIDQLIERGKELGWKMKTYDDEQLKAYDEQRRKDREETNRFLNHQDVKDRSNTYRAPRAGWKGH